MSKCPLAIVLSETHPRCNNRNHLGLKRRRELDCTKLKLWGNLNKLTFAPLRSIINPCTNVPEVLYQVLYLVLVSAHFARTI